MSDDAGKSFSTKPGATYELGVVMGPPGHGKTSFVDREQSKAQALGIRVLIIDINNNWPGHPGVICRRLDDVQSALYKYCGAGGEPKDFTQPAVIICEDADTYMRHPTGPVLHLMTSFRHLKKWPIIVSRRPQGIPKDAIESADWTAIFAIKEYYAREYLKSVYGDDVVAKVPKVGQKYQYLFIRGDQCKVYRTHKRTTITDSDIR